MRNKILELCLKKTGMIQEELAEYLTQRTGISVSQTIVSSWITGKNVPKEDFIDEMCELFDKYPQELFPEALFFEEQRIDNSKIFATIPSQPDEEIIRQEEIKFLLENFEKLSKMEIFVIGRHFGLVDGRSWTLEAIGKAMGKEFFGQGGKHIDGNPYTRERVRQIESSALEKMRERFPH